MPCVRESCLACMEEKTANNQAVLRSDDSELQARRSQRTESLLATCEAIMSKVIRTCLTCYTSLPAHWRPKFCEKHSTHWLRQRDWYIGVTFGAVAIVGALLLAHWSIGR